MIATPILPDEYEYLNHVKLPPHLEFMLPFYGMVEIRGADHNPHIIGWAQEVGGSAAYWFDSDEKPWCALFLSAMLKRSGLDYEVEWESYRAKTYSSYGKPISDPVLGDILVMDRKGGGHVCVYVGEDNYNYHALGGNQGNAINIRKFPKTRITAIRRPGYVDKFPKYFIKGGKVSEGEA